MRARAGTKSNANIEQYNKTRRRVSMSGREFGPAIKDLQDLIDLMEPVDDLRSR
ncbi:hypothetical protein GS485_17440 [Rhodococcus hoagii]|nr:hypothetical protein [Prescottella equi]